MLARTKQSSREIEDQLFYTCPEDNIRYTFLIKDKESNTETSRDISIQVL